MSKHKTEKEKPKDLVIRITQSQAKKIARALLKGAASLQEWKDATITDVFPLYSSEKNDQVAYYEVKVSTPQNDHNGCIIVSATDRKFPIPMFKPSGRTVTEELRGKVGPKAEKIIWHSPFYARALDKKGKEIAHIGQKPKIIFNSTAFKKQRKKKKTFTPPKAPGKHRNQAWESIKTHLQLREKTGNPSIGLTGLGSVTLEPPSWPDDFTFKWISGAGYHPNLDQFDWKKSSGDKVTSGCGPTAWAALLGYLDVHGEPDLLYGTRHDRSTTQVYEHGDKLPYLEKLIKKFHQDLSTDDGGDSSAWNMDEGKDTIREFLLHDATCQDEWDVPVGVLSDYYPGNEITDLIIESFDNDEPIIVGLITEKFDIGIVEFETAGHYALGLGMATGIGYIHIGVDLNPFSPGYEITETIEYTVRYILVDIQHGGGPDNIRYIGWDAIFGVWRVPRTSLLSCPRKGSFSEDFERPPEALDMDSLNGELYLAYPSSDGICIRKAAGEGYPIPTKNPADPPQPVAFNQKLIFPPSYYHYSLQSFLTDYFETSRVPELDVASLYDPPTNPTPGGGISICTWNYGLPPSLGLSDYIPVDSTSESDLWAYINWIRDLIEEARQKKGNPAKGKHSSSYSAQTTKQNLDLSKHLATPQRILDFKNKSAQKTLFGAIGLSEEIVRVFDPPPFERKSGSYMFLCWRGPEKVIEIEPSVGLKWWTGSRIHVAIIEIPAELDFSTVTEPNGLLKPGELNVAHILLPERFIAGGDPAIAIAEDQNTGPMLYIAYPERSDCCRMEQRGRILIIDLETFFQIVTTRDDLWPTEPSEPTGEPGITKTIEWEGEGAFATQVEKITRFDWFWSYFGGWKDVEHVNLQSNGKEVALLWSATGGTSHPYLGSQKLYYYKGYTFTGNPLPPTNGIIMPDWGDCQLAIPYGHSSIGKFLESTHEFTSGYYWYGPIYNRGRPDITYTKPNNFVVSWRNKDRQMFIAEIRPNSRAKLITAPTERSYAPFWGTPPSLHPITDTLQNDNMILAWTGSDEKSIVHKLFYLSPGITDYNDLPK